MRHHLLRHLHIPHDGVREVGEILLSEKRQGQLAQLFCKPDPLDARFTVGSEIRGIVLPQRRERDERQRRRDPESVQENVRGRHRSVHQVADEIIEERDGYHERDPLRDAGDHRADKSLRTLPRKRKLFHNAFDHALPPFCPAGRRASVTFQLTEVR